MLPRVARALVLLALAGGGALAAAPASAAPSGVDDFSFESMHVDFTLTRDPDGTSRLRAVETLVALFPEYDQNRGIVRDIPTEFQRIDIGVQVESVTDGAGNAVPYEESRWSDSGGIDYVELALGTDDYVHGRTTYVITWTATSVVGSYPDTASDELYWDVNGSGWAQSFGDVSATIHLGPGLAEALSGRQVCYAGGYGSTDPCPSFERTADGFELDAGAIPAFGTATMSIGFDPGTFRPGTPIEKTWPFVVLPWVLLGVLAAAALLVAVFRTFLWRHAPGRGIIIPEYEGPEDLGVMPAASLLGRPRTALPAQLVRFAVEGIARLVEDPDAPADQRYRLDLVDVSAATQPDDDTALRKLFGKKRANGESLVLDRRDRRLGDRIASLTAQMVAVPDTRGYLAQGPKSPLRRLIFWPALLVFLATLALVAYCIAEDVATPLLTVQNLVLLVGSLVVIGYSGKPTRRTAKGAEAYDRLRGLREYLRLAEADRLRVLQSPQGAVRERIDPADAVSVVRLYERLLPWAIVWGVESEWAKVLDDHYTTSAPPTSNLSFPTSSLVGLTSLTSIRSSSFATTPTPSSSSGSGGSSFSGGSFGGGFAGGGGGGGGGGGR